MVLVTNRETAEIVRRSGAGRLHYMLDSGIPPESIEEAPPERTPSTETIVLWVGKFEHLKALPLALEALARLRLLPIRLRIAGDGPRRDPWQRLVRKLGLEDRVEFLGYVDHTRMPEVYRSADIFLFTSLRDSFGCQLLEAMAQALPIVALDHQGVATFVPDGAAIKVRVSHPVETVAALADAIRDLAGSPERRKRMGRAGWEFARTETWDRRALRVTHLYEEIHASHGNPVNSQARLGDAAVCRPT